MEHDNTQLEELFNKAMIGWANQDWQPSVLPIDKLLVYAGAYRGQNNTKCLVGHLIPDDKYKPRFEGSIKPEIIEVITGVPKNSEAYSEISSFLHKLQYVHDASFRYGYNGETIKVKLREFLSHYNYLTVPDAVKESFQKKFNMALTD